jgi:putative oxidoreductase
MGAAYAVVKINGFNWRWQKQGPEYMVFWAVACVLSVWGAGQ